MADGEEREAWSAQGANEVDGVQMIYNTAAAATMEVWIRRLFH